MKPHPRIRKTVKWGGAVVCVVLVAAWVVSTWWWAQLSTPSRTVTVSEGALVLAWPDPPPDPPPYGVSISRIISFRKMLWWTSEYHTSGCSFRAIPLWMFFLPTLIATLTAWRLDTLERRRMLAGLCPKCRYDRTGLAAGAVCPECSAAAPRSV